MVAVIPFFLSLFINGHRFFFFQIILLHAFRNLKNTVYIMCKATMVLLLS